LKKIHLTEREKECLLWAAEGKTGWEIATIVNISERTVTFHLQNAAQKMGVVNRQQAISRALSMGLIEPRNIT
jgi:DNA-binding CsgD family transcriptional regulator